MTDLILITGATGTQGHAVARELLKHGLPVRALTRDPGKPAAQRLADLGADVVAGDFDDADSVRRAAAGTAAVYVMGTPFEAGPETETRQGIAVLNAVRQAGTGHVVYSSVASALDGTGIPHFESKAAVERHLAGLDVPSTVLAPAAFLENVFAPWVTPGLAEGKYGFGVPGDIPLQQIGMADLGAFAALVLQQPGTFAGQRIELASVEATGEQVADALSRWLSRDVTYVEVPVDAGDVDMRIMMEFFAAGGYTVDIAALHAAYPQVGWHDLETWGEEQDWSRV